MVIILIFFCAVLLYSGQVVIRFYERDKPYYEFTNFYEPVSPISIDKNPWKTTEHYFQAQKFIGTPYEKEIMRLRRPREALEMSRKPNVVKWWRKDWEEVKRAIMYKALLAKFKQHEYLRVMLAQTGSALLIENSPHDDYWGIGYCCSCEGQNWLGKLLMNVRSLIQKSSIGTSVDPPRQISFYPYWGKKSGIDQESDEDYHDTVDYHFVVCIEYCIDESSDTERTCENFDDNCGLLQEECEETMDVNY